MRCTQPIGHTSEVTAFLETCQELNQTGIATGMFDEVAFHLHLYKDPHGGIWEEFVQAEPWSSGPMIFLGIRNGVTGEVKGWIELDNPPYEGFEFDYDNGTLYV